MTIKYNLMTAVLFSGVFWDLTRRRLMTAKKSDLRANFRRVALEMSSTEVKNADLYVDNPNSQLSADSKTMIKGVFDFCVGIRTAELAVEQQLVYGIRAYRTETG